MSRKRSPRYPRLSLSRSIEHARLLYEGAHQSKVDVDTAAEVIGYSSSSSGAAAGALGALRQYGLVDGLRGDMSISDLAMRIIQPMDEEERIDALHEAANRPEVFSQIMNQFGGELPRSDAPILALLVRQLGFSQTGASELVDVVRDTFGSLPDNFDDEAIIDSSDVHSIISPDTASSEHTITVGRPIVGTATLQEHSQPEAGELITLPLGRGCKAEIRLTGEINQSTYDRLIRHLELLKETLD